MQENSRGWLSNRWFHICRWSAISAICLLLLALLVWGLVRCYQPASFPFHKVTLQGRLSYVDQAMVKKTIFTHVNAGFFALKTKPLEHALLANAWIKQASVRKVWPDRLVIRIIEQQPVAWWGKTAIITAQGDLIYPLEKPVHLQLPQLNGPKDSQLNVLSQFKLFNTQLQSLGLHVMQLDLSARNAWSIQLSDHMKVIIGRVDVAQRWARFLALYAKVLQDSTKKASLVDLRYPNGLAIKWQSSNNS